MPFSLSSLLPGNGLVFHNPSRDLKDGDRPLFTHAALTWVPFKWKSGDQQAGATRNPALSVGNRATHLTRQTPHTIAHSSTPFTVPGARTDLRNPARDAFAPLTGAASTSKQLPLLPPDEFTGVNLVRRNTRREAPANEPMPVQELENLMGSFPRTADFLRGVQKSDFTVNLKSLAPWMARLPANEVREVLAHSEKKVPDNLLLEWMSDLPLVQEGVVSLAAEGIQLLRTQQPAVYERFINPPPVHTQAAQASKNPEELARDHLPHIGDITAGVRPVVNALLDGIQLRHHSNDADVNQWRDALCRKLASQYLCDEISEVMAQTLRHDYRKANPSGSAHARPVDTYEPRTNRIDNGLRDRLLEYPEIHKLVDRVDATNDPVLGPLVESLARAHARVQRACLIEYRGLTAPFVAGLLNVDSSFSRFVNSFIPQAMSDASQGRPIAPDRSLVLPGVEDFVRRQLGNSPVLAGKPGRDAWFKQVAASLLDSGRFHVSLEAQVSELQNKRT